MKTYKPEFSRDIPPSRFGVIAITSLAVQLLELI